MGRGRGWTKEENGVMDKERERERARETERERERERESSDISETENSKNDQVDDYGVP